jgi:hypothetical protein
MRLAAQPAHGFDAMNVVLPSAPPLRVRTFGHLAPAIGGPPACVVQHTKTTAVHPMVHIQNIGKISRSTYRSGRMHAHFLGAKRFHADALAVSAGPTGRTS